MISSCSERDARRDVRELRATGAGVRASTRFQRMHSGRTGVFPAVGGGREEEGGGRRAQSWGISHELMTPGLNKIHEFGRNVFG